MAGHEWDWFQREELIGHISDIRVQNLQVERENVQKRTFTRWINLHLEKCNPPLEVKDLFVDIQDGKILMALLEVLSGKNLLHEYKSSTHRIFRLNNIAKALKFLEDSNVKLVSIDAAEIADGNSSLVLGLIWNIILFFQIKELTGNLNRNSSSSSLSSGPSAADSDTSHPSTPNIERSMSISVKDQRKAIRALLTWVQRKTRKYGVAVQDFASSWRSGLAFLAVIKAIDSNLVDMKRALEKSARENLEDAFSIAQDNLGVPRLLEPEDIMVESPDEQSIMTYVAQFLEHFPEIEGEDFSDPDKEFPIEATFVHIKDTPSEQEGKILILNENGERVVTVNHEKSHPPPPKICVRDLPEESQSEIAHEELNDKLNQPLSDNSQGVSEESLVLLSGEEPQRPNTLQITGSVSFESSSSWEVLSDKLIQNEGDQGSIYDDPLKQNHDLSATILTDQKNSIDTVDSESSSKEEFSIKTSTECNNEIKDSLVKTWDSCSLHQLSQTSDAHKNERTNLVEDTEPINSSFLQENASKEEDMCKYVSHLLDEEISKKLSEHPKQSPIFQTIQDTNFSSKDSEPEGQMEMSVSHKSENSTPHITKIPENLDIHSEDGSSAKMSPNSLKVSVIPHDLFYYPHYNVPISAVLEAFAKPSPDSYVSENSKICSELSMNYLHEEELFILNNEGGIQEPGLQTNLSVSPAEIDAEDMEEEKMDHDSATKLSEKVQAALIGKNEEFEEDSNISTNSQDTTDPENPEVMVDQFEDTLSAVLRPEISSKRKEKRKNVIYTENFQTSESVTAQLPDKQNEEITDHQDFSRISYSDSSVYHRKHIPNPTKKEHVSQNKQKNTDTSESTNLLIIRRKKDLEAPENAILPPEPPCVEQPELFYFIVFLWVLVYCLLLLPHLVSNKLGSLWKDFFKHMEPDADLSSTCNFIDFSEIALELHQCN